MSAATERWLVNLQNIILDIVNPRLKYSGIYDYVVSDSGPGTADARPNDGSLGLPLVRGVPLFSGLPNAQVQLTAGSHLAICFLDQNPAKPIGFAFSANSGDIGTNIILNCDAISAGDSSAAPVTPAVWATALATGLFALAGALSTAASFANVVSAGTALTNALLALPSDATTKFKGT